MTTKKTKSCDKQFYYTEDDNNYKREKQNPEDKKQKINVEKHRKIQKKVNKQEEIK